MKIDRKLSTLVLSLLMGMDGVMPFRLIPNKF